MSIIKNIHAETVSNLRNDTVDTEHRRVEWRELLSMTEDYSAWEAFEVVECPECEAEFVMSSNMGCDEHRYIQPEDEHGDEVECMGMVDHEVGPMMNFFYPCPFNDAEEAANAIAHLPLCVVVFDSGETGFALTGGGMDLTWQIADAYISCGFLPPFEYTRLPRMAGQELNKRTQLIIQACLRTVEVMRAWTESRQRDLEELSDRYGVSIEIPA